MARVIVVGSVNADLVMRVPRLPGPGETVTGGVMAWLQGGKGANRAVAAARLGADTALVGCVGDDEAGRLARAELSREGVDLTHLGRSAVPTGIAVVLVDGGGENCIALAPGANGELRAEAARSAVRALAAPGSVVVADLEVPDPAVQAAAEQAAASGARFVLNPAPARRLSRELLQHCDVLVPNQHEVSGLGQRSVQGLLAAGAGAVVLTRGAAGADLHRPGRARWHQPALPVAAVDSVGAGDAFVAALAAALADGCPLEEGVRRGAVAGALATRARGARAALPSAGELSRWAARLPLGAEPGYQA